LFQYLEKEKEVVVLLQSLENVEMSEDKKRAVIQLLEKCGTRTALGVF
jgi:hypothetical protein